MFGVRGLAPPSAPPLIRRGITTNNPILSLLSQNALRPPPNYFPYLKRRTGYRLFAQKKQHGSSLGSIELKKEANIDETDEDDLVFDEFDDDFEDDDDEDGVFDDDDDDEGEDEDEDEDVFLPFDDMRAWFKNRPKGFGEGKVYDTLIEDKLMEEIEQSRKAQVANVNKLKNASKVPTSKSELKNESKASEDVSSGVRVRISNLPKKKNILRDLKLAFEGIRGIINISPVVSGNKKTRDPVCKGFGFVDFKSLEDANRFVQMFSGKGIPFGKVEKRITCEIAKLRDTDIEDSTQDGYAKTSESRLVVSEDDEADQSSDTEQSELWENIHIDDELDEEFDDDIDDEFDEEFDDEDIVDSFESPNPSEDVKSNFEKLEKKLMSGFASATLEEKTKKKNVKKKSAPKKKTNKTTPKLKIPGSAKRLKVREKAKLGDVLTRYGSKEALASEQK